MYSIIQNKSIGVLMMVIGFILSSNDSLYSIHAFARPLLLTVPLRSATTVGAATSSNSISATDAMEQLDASQTLFIDRMLKDSFTDFQHEPDLSWSNDTTSAVTLIDDCPTILNAYKAPDSNLQWVSSVHIKGKQSSLSIVNGPKNDIPHLYSRVMVQNDDDELWLDLDFRPRSTNVQEFEMKFADETIINFLKRSYVTLEDAHERETNKDDDNDSPISLSLSMPLTEHNVKELDILRDQAAKFWFMWTLTHPPSEEEENENVIQLQSKYDAQHQTRVHEVLQEFYKNVYGEKDGTKLAKAEVGPLLEEV